MKHPSLPFLLPFLLLSCTSPEANIPIPSQEIKDDDLHFLIASDLHFLDPSLRDETFAPGVRDISSDGKATYYSGVVVDAFVSEVIEKHPDALFLCGDLTLNGARVSNDVVYEKLLSIQKEDIPVYLLPGNHDVGITFAYRFLDNTIERVDTYSPQEFQEKFARFGYAQAEYKDPNSFSYFKEVGDNIWAFMLDANTRTINLVYSETLVWLTKVMEELDQKGAKIITFSHQSLFSHHSLLNVGYQIANAEEVLASYQAHGVLANFAGHSHIQHYKKERGMVEILNSCLDVYPGQYGSLYLHDGVWSYHTNGLDVSAYAEKQGYTDPNLLDFPTCLKNYFDASNCAGFQKEVNQIEGLNQLEKNEISSTLFTLNEAYFAGMPVIFDDSLNHAMSLLDSHAKDFRYYPYVQEMVADLREGNDYRYLQF